MSPKMKYRSGSALLIVLGMLTFMVVSAVGFAVYMRQSRVPSSHLRREATSRYLLKSALANAISRINGEYNGNVNRAEGIYDDPYPGLTPNGYNSGSDQQWNGDYWCRRVFAPFGLTTADQTVSTLTLEGLAYLPPAIINEVRVYARRTKTAQWRNLSYDLGRYAFCAVDVSDCFDINKLAKVKRRSSSPGERISLTSLFPDDADTLANDLKAKQGNIPFISLADFNVAFGSTKFTPVMRYLGSGSQGNVMYDDSDADSVSNALFITDTWFPATNAFLDADLKVQHANVDKSRFFDLSVRTDQPWKEGDFNANNFLEVDASSRLGEVLRQNLSVVGMACLYDYLDKDQLPISLALPTTEAVPMVCGVSLAVNDEVAFTFGTSEKNPKQESTWTPQNSKATIKRTVTGIDFKGIDGGPIIVTGTVAFPFKRMKTEKRGKTSFKVEALVAVFFAPDDLRCRLENDAFRPTQEDWAADTKVRNGIVFYKSSPTAVAFDSDIERTKDAFKDFTLTVNCGDLGDKALPVCYHITEKPEGVVTTGLPPLETNVITLDGIKGDNTFKFYDRRGYVDEGFKNKCGQQDILTGVERADGKKQNPADFDASSFHPHVAVWVRVLDESDTVDLVPATIEDDASYLGCSFEGGAEEKLSSSLSGTNVPILDFKDGAQSIALNVFQNEESQELSFSPSGWKSLFAVDPRYNFAPEDWFGTNDQNARHDTWLALMGLTEGSETTVVFGSGCRDRDPFMFTSDQEVLQSIGELQFLPYVQRLGRDAGGNLGDFSAPSRYHGDGNFTSRGPSNLGGFANGSRFWRTYSGFARSGGRLDDDDPYYDLAVNDERIEVVNGAGDFRVNPLSDDPRIVASAIFDTPWDYYVASTNKTNNKLSGQVQNSPERYAFGTESDLTHDRWDEEMIARLANNMRSEIRNKARSGNARFDWGLAYENLVWDCDGAGDGQDQLFNANFSSDTYLHSVDRKFLFSFWRECFQNRQHLFLVFIRAEPLTVGGAGGDALANSQLGARGVALIWRDPLPPAKSNGRLAREQITNRSNWRANQETNPPHRIRVLFYHQFE